MRAQLEKLRTAHNIPKESYQRAYGTAEGGQPDREGNGGRNEQAPAQQASEGLAPAERPPASQPPTEDGPFEVIPFDTGH